MSSPLTCLLISDTHGEFDRDGGIRMAESLPHEGVDVLLAAGDICTLDNVHDVASVLCDRFPRVLWTCGNHEFYKAGRLAVEKQFQELEGWSNFSWMKHRVVTIDQVVFAGTTSWWGPHPENPTQDDIDFISKAQLASLIDAMARERWDGRGDKTTNLGRIKAQTSRALKKRQEQIRSRAINDFFYIPGILDWVYEEWEKDLSFLRHWAPQADVVVTHLAPSLESSLMKYRTSPLTRYYWNDLEELVETCGASYWCHGHMHNPSDYRLGRTRVLCEPRGYPHEHQGREYGGFLFEVSPRTDRFPRPGRSPIWQERHGSE